jgi:hypothetical protein
MDLDKFVTTYTADNSQPFWICAVKDCSLTFPHEVGYTEERNPKHVYVDFYLPYPSGK